MMGSQDSPNFCGGSACTSSWKWVYRTLQQDLLPILAYSEHKLEPDDLKERSLDLPDKSDKNQSIWKEIFSVACSCLWMARPLLKAWFLVQHFPAAFCTEPCRKCLWKLLSFYYLPSRCFPRSAPSIPFALSFTLALWTCPLLNLLAFSNGAIFIFFHRVFWAEAALTRQEGKLLPFLPSSHSPLKKTHSTKHSWEIRTPFLYTNVCTIQQFWTIFFSPRSESINGTPSLLSAGLSRGNGMTATCI